MYVPHQALYTAALVDSAVQEDAVMGPVNVLALYMIDIDKNGIDIKH